MPRTVLWSMIRQDARPSEPERSRARCRPMRAAKCCWQMAPVDGAGQLRVTGMERCTRQRRGGRRRSMQTLRAIVTHKRSTQRSVQSPSGTVRAPCSVQTLGIIAHQLDGIAAPARTVKALLQRMPVFWLTLSISSDELRLFCVKATPLVISALRYSLFSHVFIAKCRTQRPSARKPRRLSAINRQS